MNWGKVLIGGVVAGVVGNLVDFVIHQLVLGETYMQYPVFTQEQVNPLYFLAIAVLIGIMAAILFTKTRAVWPTGLAGGATFGFFVGLLLFFFPFYSALVIEGFPYFLSWVWGVTYMISSIVYGLVLSLFIKPAG